MSKYAIGVVSCCADRFKLRMNICAKKPAYRKSVASSKSSPDIPHIFGNHCLPEEKFTQNYLHLLLGSQRHQIFQNYTHNFSYFFLVRVFLIPPLRDVDIRVTL